MERYFHLDAFGERSSTYSKMPDILLVLLNLLDGAPIPSSIYFVDYTRFAKFDKHDGRLPACVKEMILYSRSS